MAYDADLDLGEIAARRVGSLRHKMTRAQLEKVCEVIGQGFPSVVAYHPAGIARVMVAGKEIFVDGEGKIVTQKQAIKSEQAWQATQPKRGRPRKVK